MTVATGFEKCLITTWEAWDLADTLCIVFYDAVLNQDFGLNFSAGDKVEIVTFDFGNNFIEVVSYDETSEKSEKSEKRKIEVTWI